MLLEDSLPLQIFLIGPARSGKTFLMKLLMETYNCFSQKHNSIYNSYVACASIGLVAAGFDGTTVYSTFGLKSKKEALSSFFACVLYQRSESKYFYTWLGLSEIKMIDAYVQSIKNSFFQSYKQSELQEFARKLNIKHYYKLSKLDLVIALEKTNLDLSETNPKKIEKEPSLYSFNKIMFRLFAHMEGVQAYYKMNKQELIDALIT